MQLSSESWIHVKMQLRSIWQLVHLALRLTVMGETLKRGEKKNKKKKVEIFCPALDQNFPSTNQRCYWSVISRWPCPISYVTIYLFTSNPSSLLFGQNQPLSARDRHHSSVQPKSDVAEASRKTKIITLPEKEILQLADAVAAKREKKKSKTPIQNRDEVVILDLGSNAASHGGEKTVCRWRKRQTIAGDQQHER